MRWSLVVCAALAACDGSKPGLLGEYVSVISSPQAAAADAALPDPQLDAGQPAPVVDAGIPTAPADAAVPPSAPAAGSPATTPPPSAPQTPPPTQPTTTPPPTTQPMRSPDYVAVAMESVSERPVGIENYTCALTDLVVDEDTWVTGIEVAPQHPDYTFRATVSFHETCDALGVVAPHVFDYFPSNHRLDLPAGHAFLLPASARISVQLHYSGLSATAPSTDTQLTEVRLWTLPQGERPQYQVSRQIFHAFNITIPIGATDLEITTQGELTAESTPAGAEIIGITPVVHFLGQKIFSTLFTQDGLETVILSLDDWSIDARKDYLLDPSRYIAAPPRAIQIHACTYSNRPEDQALDAAGRPFTPQLTTFGEDARNEQCRTSLLLRHPL